MWEKVGGDMYDREWTSKICEYLSSMRNIIQFKREDILSSRGHPQHTPHSAQLRTHRGWAKCLYVVVNVVFRRLSSIFHRRIWYATECHQIYSPFSSFIFFCFTSCRCPSSLLFIYLFIWVFMFICKENLMAFRRANWISYRRRWWKKCTHTHPHTMHNAIALWARREKGSDDSVSIEINENAMRNAIMIAKAIT